MRRIAEFVIFITMLLACGVSHQSAATPLPPTLNTLDGRSTLLTRVASGKLEIIVDEVTGVRIGIPTAIVGEPKKVSYGRTWEGSRKRLSIDTLLFRDESLAALFERLSNVPGRKLKRKEINADEFHLEGSEDKGTTLFYVHARARGDEVRGLSVVYWKSASEELREVVDAVIDSFDPFPDKPKANEPLPPRIPPKQPASERIAELENQLKGAKKKADDLKKKEQSEDVPAWVKAILAEQRAQAERDRQLIFELIKSLREKGSQPAEYGLPSGKRLALVVGVNKYAKLAPAAQLKTATGDASAIANTLKQMGFDVTLVTDPDRSIFYQQWEKFRKAVDTGTSTAFFFAGHGIQVSHVNYLLLGDTPGESIVDDALIRRMAVDFNQLREELHERRPRLSLYILDACRNNPYKGSSTRALSETRGLAKVEAGKGTFVMYSAETGEEALDRLPGDPTEVQNSVYTRRLLPLLVDGNLTLQAAAQRVRAEVQELARGINHSQTPAYYDGLIGLVCLSSSCSKSTQVLSSK